MAHPRSMKVKEVKCEGLQATVVQRAAENNFKSVLFAIINCPETASLAREVFKTKIATECRNYAKQRNSLNTTDIFLFPSSRASRSCRAPREISRSPRLAHKAPVMQAIKPTSTCFQV